MVEAKRQAQAEAHKSLTQDSYDSFYFSSVNFLWSLRTQDSTFRSIYLKLNYLKAYFLILYSTGILVNQYLAPDVLGGGYIRLSSLLNK